VNQKDMPKSQSYYVTNSDSLMNHALNAIAGDTILCAAGTFPVSIRFTNSGTPDNPIVIMGTDSQTVFKPQPGNGILFLSSRHSIHFSRITFDSSFASGAKIEDSSYDIAFSDCIFQNNVSDGLEIVDSDVRIVNCRFLRNALAGIRINGNGSGTPGAVVTNALVAHNTQNGIIVTAAPLTLLQSTISNNGKSGITLTTPAGDVVIKRSIVSFNAGAGLSGLWAAGTANLAVDSLDIFGNDSALSLSPPVAFTTWTSDPLFTDTSNNDYKAGIASEVYALEQQGIIVGYRP